MRLDDKHCPECSKVMIQRDTSLLLTHPPQQEWQWWCACGHTEIGGTRTPYPTSEHDLALKKWQEANDTPPNQYGPLEIQDPVNRDKAAKALTLLSYAMELYKVRPGGLNTPEKLNEEDRLKAYNAFAIMILGDDRPSHEVWT